MQFNSTTESPDMYNSTNSENSTDYDSITDLLNENSTDVFTENSTDYPDTLNDTYEDFNKSMESLFVNITEDVKKLFTTNQSIYIYTFCIICSIVLTTARSLLFFKVCMNSSRGLHHRMFNNILQATMRFFDTNPSGKIFPKITIKYT